MNRINWLLAILASSAVIALIVLYNRTTDEAGTITISKPAPEVKTVERIIHAAPKVVYVYPDEVKKKLKLPEATQLDKAASVVASSKVDPSDNPHTVTTVIDTETGKFTTYTRTDPLPWLAFDSHGELALSYGFKGINPTGRLSVRQNILQVKALRVQVSGTVDQDGETYAGVGMAYRW